MSAAGSALSGYGEHTTASTLRVPRGESPGLQFLRRFRRHRLAVLGTVVMVVLAGLVICAPLVARYDPNQIDILNKRQPPTAQHWLGTDDLGRDVWSRLIYGGRVSLSVGLVAVTIYTTIGIVLGAVAGYRGGWIDGFLVWLTDVVLSFPSLLIIVALVALIGPSVFNVMLVIGLLGWPSTLRLVRSQFLDIRDNDFVTAARCIGVSPARLVFRQILPNTLAPVIVTATFGMASAILTEAGLSFLGLGVQVPIPTWGSMLNAAKSLLVIESMPWLWLPPGLMIVICVLCINFMGDGLRDALDPRSSRR